MTRHLGQTITHKTFELKTFSEQLDPLPFHPVTHKDELDRRRHSIIMNRYRQVQLRQYVRCFQLS